MVPDKQTLQAEFSPTTDKLLEIYESRHIEDTLMGSLETGPKLDPVEAVDQAPHLMTE